MGFVTDTQLTYFDIKHQLYLMFTAGFKDIIDNNVSCEVTEIPFEFEDIERHLKNVPDDIWNTLNGVNAL